MAKYNPQVGLKVALGLEQIKNILKLKGAEPWAKGPQDINRDKCPGLV